MTSAGGDDIVDDWYAGLRLDSGSTFPLGLTTVTCSATDAHGNTSSGSFDVTVQDTTAPTLTLPGDIAVEATGSTGAAVTFGASASDAVDGSVTPDCDATSGATFPLGLTTVTCSATDAHGNTSSGSFDVTVQDTTAPTLTLPGDITVFAASAAGASVPYLASATDLVDGTLPISCSPASGTTFPAGTSTVACSAMDAHGNQATGNFKVKVAYVFNGFFQPIDNPAGGAITWNKAKAGSAIPVKFSLGGDRGMNILADGALLASTFGAPPAGPSSSPWAEKVTCGSAVTEDVIENTVTANASGLIYDPGAKQYSYVSEDERVLGELVPRVARDAEGRDGPRGVRALHEVGHGGASGRDLESPAPPSQSSSSYAGSVRNSSKSAASATRSNTDRASSKR